MALVGSVDAGGRRWADWECMLNRQLEAETASRFRPSTGQLAVTVISIVYQHCSNPLSRVTAAPITRCWLVRRLGGGLFLHRHGHVGICREPNPLIFHISHQPEIDLVMMAFVASFAAIGLRELNPVALHTVDRPDVNAVCADDLHVLFDI